MIYTIPTPHGLGIEIWGLADELEVLYDMLFRFWGSDKYMSDKSYQNRDLLISGFSYQLRKSFEGSRLIRNSSHFSSEPIQYYGGVYSWVQVIFVLNALRYNMRFAPSTAEDLSLFSHLETACVKSLRAYDKVGARLIEPFLANALYSGNEYIYHFMISIHDEYILNGGGKLNFRKLPSILMRGVYQSSDYNHFRKFLQSEAKRLKCEIHELSPGDSGINYGTLEW